jgi:hypothetical protein
MHGNGCNIVAIAPEVARCVWVEAEGQYGCGLHHIRTRSPTARAPLLTSCANTVRLPHGEKADWIHRYMCCQPRYVRVEVDFETRVWRSPSLTANSAGAWRVGSVGPCAERWAAGGAVRNQSRNGIARTVVHQAPPATKQRRKPHFAAAVCGARSVSWVLLLPLVQSARRARPTPLLIRATTPTSAQSQATPGRKMADGRASAMDLAAAAVLAAINSRRADAT